LERDSTVYIPSLKVGTATNGIWILSTHLELEPFNNWSRIRLQAKGLSNKFTVRIISLDIDISASNSLEEVQIVAKSKPKKYSEVPVMSVMKFPHQKFKDIPANF